MGLRKWDFGVGCVGVFFLKPRISFLKSRMVAGDAEACDWWKVMQKGCRAVRKEQWGACKVRGCCFCCSNCVVVVLRCVTKRKENGRKTKGVCQDQ